MLFSMTTVYADKGEVNADNAEKEKTFKLYYFNFTDGDYIVKNIQLKAKNHKIEKVLIEQMFQQANIPDTIEAGALNKGVSLLDVEVQEQKLVVNLDIEKESLESLIYLTNSLKTTIFENVSHINEVKLLNRNMEIDSSNYPIDLTSSICRPSEVNSGPIQNIIPDVPNPVIVLDPGHGGKYNHASYNGILEKNVVLVIAKKVKALLESRGATVYLTRDGDYHLDGTSDKADCLARGQIAADVNADLFISIHCNGWTTPDANGIEVYYQDSTYAYSSISKSLAKSIVDQMNIFTGMKLRQGGTGIAPNNYWVFQTSDAISVLIEAGFITNAYDREYLTVSSKQDILANSIYVGIRKFWWGY